MNGTIGKQRQKIPLISFDFQKFLQHVSVFPVQRDCGGKKNAVAVHVQKTIQRSKFVEAERSFRQARKNPFREIGIIGSIADLAQIGMRPASPMVRRKRDFFEWEFTKKMNAVGL